MELVVIRHAETQANAEGRYQGALDIGLNDDGVRQISCLAEKVAVAQQPFDRLLASLCCEQGRVLPSCLVSWDCLWSLCRPFVNGMSACLKG